MRTLTVGLIALFVAALVVVGWWKQDKIASLLRSNQTFRRATDGARSAYGRIHNAATRSASNLAHTESNPEPIG